MIYAIILLFVLVIFLYFRITYVRNKSGELLKLTTSNLIMRFEGIFKTVPTNEVKRLFRESQINSIIGKEDRLITLLKEAKERGYFEKKFIPVNEHLVFKHNPSDIICNYRYNIVNDSLWIPSHCVGTIGMGIEMIYLNGKWAKIVEEKCEQKKQSLSSDTFKCQNCGNIQNSWEYSSGKTGCCDNCGCVSCDRIEENSPKVEDIPSLSTDEMIGVLKNLYPDKKVQKNLSDLEISIMDLKNKNNL